MDTLSNLANTATTYIYGDKRRDSAAEPVAGEQGKGTAEDPFDKGNVEDLNKATKSEEAPKHEVHDETPKIGDLSLNEAPKPGEQPPKPQEIETSSNTDMNPLTTTPATNPTEPHHGSVATGAATEAVDSTRDTTAGGFGTVGSSASAHPGHAAKSTDKQQGADRPEDAPTGEQKSAIDNVKKEGEKAMGEAPASKSKQSRGFSVADDGGQKVLRTEQEREELAEKGELPKDPNDNSGEPMKMHDGNEDKARAERKASVQEGGGEHGKVKGTGEQYVKTSGVAAEGGDFDATKPGAGREATRLLEEKGIHKTPGKVPEEPTEAVDDKKPSKMEKLRDKLHIGTGKHI